jgi:hypothetical protein
LSMKGSVEVCRRRRRGARVSVRFFFEIEDRRVLLLHVFCTLS